ncbi:frizzled-8-like [Dendronephthya gigantea]|uniref:frizzled-8-like n=1 Tax=Dendronephthya gigantea TaxID=151771 RepID=UPI00106AABCB|nr:frizzled-8-like [Dendronephthya gigantea]
MTGRRTMFMCIRLILFILVLVYHLANAAEYKCEEITIPLCMNLGYNTTYSPNRFLHEDQKEAALEVHQFWPLVQINCSPVLKFFLCSLYAPVCDELYGKELLPCRSVCHKAKSGCLKLMKTYGFKWPEKMECDKFPQKKDNQLCMSDDDQTTTAPTLIGPSPSAKTTNSWIGATTDSASSKKLPSRPQRRRPKPTNTGVGRSTKSPVSTPSPQALGCQCSCAKPFIRVPPKLERHIGDVQDCALPCNASYFTSNQRSFATAWVTIWSTMCFVSTFLTLATFFLDTARFRYPERPVIFLSSCYLLMSFGYIMRLIAGKEKVSCDQDDLIAHETTGPALCTLVFLLTYFGGMASALWWVVLSFTWFLSAGMKWSNEAIANVSQYFHIVAWLIPSVQTISVLAMSSIDGDSLSGVCSVGNQNKDSLVAFMIVPLGIYLTIGSAFLLAGFVSLFRIRKKMQNEGNNTNKLEKLMVRIGVFSVLYTVPATVTIGCYLYEMSNRSKWEKWLTCANTPCAGAEKVEPEYSVFIVRYFMSLVVGISTGFWICSMKTVDSWRNLIKRHVGSRLLRPKNADDHDAEKTALRLTKKTDV